MTLRVLMLCGLTALVGCQTSEPSHLMVQRIAIDERKWLLVKTEGDGLKVSSPGITEFKRGEAVHRVHRVLETADEGKILFTYDLEVTAPVAGGPYRLSLKPIPGAAPTFETSREVTVTTPGDTVSVELMANPETGQKIVDTFTLGERRESSHEGIFYRIQRAHDSFRRWVHGE